VGIFCNILVVFAIAYLLAKAYRIGVRRCCPSAIIAGSNHFEVAIAVATSLFGLTVVGVLTEGPFMLFLSSYV